MGKNKSGSSTKLGRAIIKDRFAKHDRRTDKTYLHTSELPDGYDWARLNLQSVTEQSNLDDFLTTAELAGTEFTAEKENIKFVDAVTTTGLPSVDELIEVKTAQEQHKEWISIPRRPYWDDDTSAEQLGQAERDEFLNWRRKLAELQEIEHIILTPYEKNLDFWRQLWRVIERSDVIVQIVDARNPLLFRCKDLETYVKEVDMDKVNMVLINKADFLTQRQRELWAAYFEQEGVKAAFWSATDEEKRLNPKKLDEEDHDDSGMIDEEYCEKNDDASDSGGYEDHETNVANSDSVPADSAPNVSVNSTNISTGIDHLEDAVENVNIENNATSLNTLKAGAQAIDSRTIGKSDTHMQSLDSQSENSNNASTNSTKLCSKCGINFVTAKSRLLCDDCEKIVDETGDGKMASKTETIHNSSSLLMGEELLDLFRSLHTGRKYTAAVTTVGMVGYPNVGKSSTINTILQLKKVPVSTTPGRTKHFQTLFVDPELMLCDCPGLVFPSFVSTKAELIVNGILPIDRMTDYVGPVSLVCQHIPRPALECRYGINIPLPDNLDDPERPPTSHELLSAYGAIRGFMTVRGLPDEARAARYILKDYVNGRLLYAHPIPACDIDDFMSSSAADTETSDHVKANQKQGKNPLSLEGVVDSAFFRKTDTKVYSKGVHGVGGYSRTVNFSQHHSATESGSVSSGSMQSLSGKPWKKHNNRNKKEKVRRTFAHLDKH